MAKKINYWKLLLGTTSALLVIYAFASTYLWARQAHFIFSPERIISKTPAEYQLPFEDIFIMVNDRTGKNERIHAWWIPAENPSDRCLLYLHGSALNIGANITHARRFRHMGFSVLLVSYRGYGKSDGMFPTEKQVYADAQTAWNYLVEQKGFDPGDIYIYGHSLGGAVAIELALNNPSAGGLIVESAFTSIVDLANRLPKYRIFPNELIVRQRFESIKKVGRLKVPVLYIHGTDDNLVPHEMSRKLYEQTASHRQLLLIHGGGHNNSATVGGDKYLMEVQNFIQLMRKNA